MARRVRMVVGFLAGFFFMRIKLNKNLYKVNTVVYPFFLKFFLWKRHRTKETLMLPIRGLYEVAGIGESQKCRLRTRPAGGSAL